MRLHFQRKYKPIDLHRITDKIEQKMKSAVNYEVVPSKREEDFNPGKTVWRDGRLVSIDEGPAVTLYLAHSQDTAIDAEGTEQEVTRAFAVRVVKPLTRDRAINAAEMAGYGLTSAEDTASFNAALSRKWREDINDEEVKEHDEFIRWVKSELDKIGLVSRDKPVADTTLPSLVDVMNLSRILFETADIPTEKAVNVKNFAPIWGEEGAEMGKNVQVGFLLRVVDKQRMTNELFEVISPHELQAQWKPGTTGTESLYKRLDETHAGTIDDPIPYPADGNMALELGKYYEEDGVVYECIEATTPLYAKLKDCPRYAKAVG